MGRMDSTLPIGHALPETLDDLSSLSPDIVSLERDKKSAYNWQERRHTEWEENYLLYRDKVTINRLTQRQSVNVPLMKTTIKTALKDVDDPPLLYFKSLSNNEEKEIFYNEYFEYTSFINRIVIKDIIDKKQVFLYGRSFKKLNIVDGKFYLEVLDPHDILVDRYVDPADMDTARYVCHQHIFRPLSSLDMNESYDKEAVARLRSYMATNAGLIKADSNLQTLTDRNGRMRTMGVPDVDNPQLGETYIEINEHYKKKYNEELGMDEFYLIVTAEGREVLCEKPLDEVIGKTKDDYWKTHLPIETWGDDMERTDFWSDGMADTIRTPNKILNSQLSQQIENRTLRNYGMNYYDATIDGFVPQTLDPVPFGWYPLPGKPSEVFQKVDIPDLSEGIDEMNFVLQLAEKATAATSIQQGVSESRKITLGEVQILQENAKARIKSLSVFYVNSWENFGMKYVKMLEAAGDMLDAVTLYKKGLQNDNMYPREISPRDWMDKSGYVCKVMSRDEKEKDATNMIQKLNAAVSAMPDNIVLRKVYNKKLLEFSDLTPEDTRQILEFEEEKIKAMMNPQMRMGGSMGSPMSQQGAMGAQAIPQLPMPS